MPLCYSNNKTEEKSRNTMKMSRQPTVPPISCRTLHHPSFMPLYMAADFEHHHMGHIDHPVHPIIPEEFFYSDPTMSRGKRISNTVSELKVFECFQLNTPPPVMSACPAPPVRPDPFRSGPHPIRDLGSLTCETDTLRPPGQPSHVILQLTQEEDQAVTILLKLHHQEPVQSDDIPSLCHPEGMDSTSAEEVYEPLFSDVQHPMEGRVRGQVQQGRCWSDAELEAANTLWSLLSLMEGDKIWLQEQNEPAVTLPDPKPHQHQGSESPHPTPVTDCTQKDDCVSCTMESGGPDWRGLMIVEGNNTNDILLPVHDGYLASSLPPKLRSPSSNSNKNSGSSVSGDFSEVTERTLSDSEEDAVLVLLSLGDMGAFDIVQ